MHRGYQAVEAGAGAVRPGGVCGSKYIFLPETDRGEFRSYFYLPAVSSLLLESVRKSGSSDIKGRFYSGEADGSFKDMSPEAKQGRAGGKALSGFACSGNMGGGYGS